MIDPRDGRWGDGESPDSDAIARATARGVFYSVVGQSLLFLGGLFGGILLSRSLTPRDFGVYAIVGFVVLRLNALAEFGLNAALIQQAQPPTLVEQRGTWTLQCVMATGIYATIYGLAPALSAVFRMGEDAVPFLRTVGALILVQPMRTVPLALLSRRLSYGVLTLVEVADGLTYQVTAVALALGGFSYWSFGWAALVSTAIGTALLNAYCPWRIGLAWSWESLRGSLRFGGAYQLASLTAVIRDNISTLLAGPLFGPAAVGLLNWSLRLAWVCSQTYVAVCARVAFPSLSRMRVDRERFAGALTKMLRYLNFATVFSLSLVAALAPEIVRLVYTDKWAVAIPLFYWFCVRMLAANFTTLLDVALKAEGRPETSLRVLSVWTLGETLLAVIGAATLGYAGIAVAGGTGIWVAVVWLGREVSRFARIDLWRASATPLLCGAATWAVLYWGKGAWIDGGAALGIAALAGLGIYVGVALLIEGLGVWTDLKGDLRVLMSRQASTASIEPALN